MKKINLIIVFTFLFQNFIFSQTVNRNADPNYMWNSLVEEFNGDMSSLRQDWNITSHYKRDLGFLVDNPSSIVIQNGNLELKMKYVSNYLDSIWKSTGWEQVYSNYTGSEISTKKQFHYGIFECRAKFAKKPGSWPAFWLLGNDGAPCPPGGYGNEIDIAEMFSHQPYPIMKHVIHRYYPPANCDVSNIVQKDIKSYNVDYNEAYQTFKCIWTPSKIDIT